MSVWVAQPQIRQSSWLERALLGKTYGDFLLSPGWGVAKSRKEISLATHFSEHIKLNIPVVSANMDTITGARMAIAMAREGGLGVIHRYMTIEDQVKRVAEVKRAEGFIISEPYTIRPNATMQYARELLRVYKVGGLVVVDDEGIVLGMLSGRDVRFAEDHVHVVERMTPRSRLIVASSLFTFDEMRERLDAYRLEKLPIVDQDDRLVGLVTARDIENLQNFPLANKDSGGRLIVGAAIGATGDYLERAAGLLESGCDVLVLDIANAQSDVALSAVKEFRAKYTEAELVVGNIAIGRAIALFDGLNVNGYKVGLGPGSACTTRRNTNMGIPQLQAIYDCSVRSSMPINADGGITRNGDVALALMLGASSVMLGGVLAGTDETPGLAFRNSAGRMVKTFRGMASREAMHDRIRAEGSDNPYEVSAGIAPEGVPQEIEPRGSVIPIIRDMATNIASSISYLGARSLMEARQLFAYQPEKYLVPLSEASRSESFPRKGLS